MASKTELGADEILDLLKQHNQSQDNAASMPLPDMSNYSQPMGMDQDKVLSTPDPMTAAIQAAPPLSQNTIQTNGSSFPLPNGGMVGQQLTDYIKAHPGPVATTGKNLNLPDKPDDSDDDKEDDEKPASPLRKLASKLKAAQAKQASPPAVSPPKPTDVNDVIAKLLGAQNDQMNAAQSARNTNQLFVNLGKAGNQIGAALAHTTPNNEVFNDLEKQAGQPLTDLASKKAMEGEALKQADVKSKLKTEMEKEDPNSAISKQYRDAVEKMLGKPIDPTMSAASLEKISPLYEKIWQASENGKNRLALAQEKQSQKISDKQNQAVQQTTQLMESARGDAAFRQAQLDRYNATKAQSLINLYGDPNKLSPSQVALVSLEVGKVGKGGTPDKEEFQLLNNSTIRSKLAGIISKVTNSPSPANAGEFLKQYNDYLDKVSDDAKDVMKNKYQRILNVKKKDLKDRYDDFNDSYIKPLDQEDGPKKKDNGKVKVTNGKESYMIDPSDLSHAKEDGFKQVE